MTLIPLGVLLSWLVLSDASPPCPNYGCTQQYLPSPPGKAPPCAHGRTYCDYIEHYPSHVVEYLIKTWQYDYSTFFTDEKNDNFRPRPVYGPPPVQSRNALNFQFPVPTYYQTPPPPIQQEISFVYNQSSDGYPDRKYPLGDHNFQYFNSNPGLVYPTELHQDASGSAHWWKRHTKTSRKRRQTGLTSSLCPTRAQYVMPMAAMNNQGNWKFVINLDNTTQSVRLETCISPNSECDRTCGLPNGYSSQCTQQFVQKKLIALHGSGSNLYTDIFWFPHCCLCQINQNFR